MGWYQWALVGISAVGALGCLVFLVRYILGVPGVIERGAWKGHEVGRWLVGWQSLRLALFVHIILAVTMPTWPGRELAGITLFSVFAVSSWWPNRILNLSVHKRRTLVGKDPR